MKKYSFLILLSAGMFQACTYQKNNTIDQDDFNANNEYVYGVHKDSIARQLKQTYTAKPELAARTEAIREKLYGPPAVETAAAAPAATAVKDSTAK
jgi:hypothetical protein